MSTTNLVDRGLQLRAEILLRRTELEAIENQLQAIGLASCDEHVDLKDVDREGRRWLAMGSEKIVPVIFTADKIIGSFKSNGSAHEMIYAALGRRREKLMEFYKAETTWGILFKDGKRFRMAARDILGKGAPAFISACVARDKFGVAKSDIKIEWEAAETIKLK